MANGNIFLFWLAIPFAGAVLAAALPRSLKSAAAFVSLAAALAMGVRLFSTESFVVSSSIASRLGASAVFAADGFAFFMALTVLTVSLLIALYSHGYMAGADDLGEFYFLFLVFVGSMMGLVFSDHLVALYVFWELTAVCSWRLIGIRRQEKHIAAANQAFMITSVGAVAMLAGIALIYAATGTFSLAALREYRVGAAASLLIIAGIFSKSAQLPLHLWLPDAGVAPTPVTALLHAAVLVKIGAYAFWRFFNASMTLEPAVASFVSIASVVTAIVAAAAAAKENDIKRILAYSTMSQLAYIIFAFSLNTITAVAAGFIYIMAHSFAKAGLFLAAGVVEHTLGAKDIRRLGGLKKTMPYTDASFIVCALSVVGIPPTVGFFAKYAVISAALDSHRFYSAVFLLAAAVMTMYYIFRLYRQVFTGEAGEAATSARESSASMVFAVALFGIISLALGLLIKFPTAILSRIL